MRNSSKNELKTVLERMFRGFDIGVAAKTILNGSLYFLKKIE